MYGVEFRARLNDRSNISGFGWGYLNPSTILGVNDVKVEGEEFASAGLGLNIPLSKKFFNNWW
jgi:hypothetical protein